MQKLAEICVRRPVFATMLILSLTVVGLFSYKSLGVDLFPKIDLPTITVTVVNPGASPQEVETEITDKVEGAVNTISGIDELRSTSVEGVSQVFITFLLEKNPDVAAQEVRNKIELIANDLPVTAEQPIVQKLDTDAAPVVRIAVSAPRSLREVTDVADKKIKQQIESINGVGQVQIIGGRQREIQVWVDPDKLRAYNVTVAEVANSVRAQNLEVPGGRAGPVGSGGGLALGERVPIPLGIHRLPLGAERRVRRHRIKSPVNEDAELRIGIPGRTRTGVK